MSTLLTIDETLTLLKDTYKAIDIRGILARKKDDPNWIAAFLKIRFTMENQAFLQDVHRKILDDRGEIRYDNLQVILYSKGIEELDVLKQELGRGQFTFNGTTFSLPETDFQNIPEKPLTTQDTLYTTDKERLGYSHRLVFSSISCSVWEFIRRLGITENDYGGKLSRVRFWLDTHDLDDGNPINVAIIFPIYCKKIENPANQRGQTIVTYEIHNQLLPGCSGEITKLPGDEYKTFRPIDYSTNLGDMIIISVPLSLMPIYPDDYVRTEIRHNILGVIANDTIETDMILTPPYKVDPLLDAFLSIGAKDRLKEYIFSTKYPKRQEQATSWLLSLLGFRNVYFNQFENQDQQIIGAPQYSVDIIAEYSTDNLLAIDCVTDVPDSKDITQAKNAADLIEVRISKTVTPIIFSSQPCEGMKQEAQASRAFIIDQRDISSLCDMLLSGHSLQARNFFAGLMSPQREVS